MMYVWRPYNPLNTLLVYKWRHIPKVVDQYVQLKLAGQLWFGQDLSYFDVAVNTYRFTFYFLLLMLLLLGNQTWIYVERPWNTAQNRASIDPTWER